MIAADDQVMEQSLRISALARLGLLCVLALTGACRTSPLDGAVDEGLDSDSFGSAGGDLACRALKLDLAGSYAVANTIPEIAGSFSVEAWTFLANPASAPNGGVILGQFKEFYSPYIIPLTSPGYLEVDIQGSQGTVSSTSSRRLPRGRWVHVAFVVDGNSREGRFFIDGTADPTPVANLLSLSSASGFPLYMGGAPVSSFGPGTLRGYLAEVRLSSTVRYQQDFVPAATFVPDRETIALYHLRDALGAAVAKEASANASDATLVGDARFDVPPSCLGAN